MSISPSISEPNIPEHSLSNSIFRWLGIQLRPPGGIWQKISAILAASTLLIIGFVANRTLDGITDYLFPDATLHQVLTTQEIISNKVSSIESLSASISKQVEDGESYLSKSLQSDTELLVSELKELRTAVQTSVEVGGRAAKSFAEAKGAELLSQNFSKQSDFMLLSGQGATVCPDGYIFGMRYRDDTSIIAVLSGGGLRTEQVLQPGGSLVLTKASGGLVQVGYQGKYGNENSPLFGFSVICTK
jgi:hypothetical protein